MARRKSDGREDLERIQIVNVREWGILMTDEQVLAIERDRHLRGCIAGTQGRDLLIRNAVKDQNLIFILPQYIKPRACRVGENVNQGSRHVDHGAALIGRAIIDQDANDGRNIDRRP